MISNIKILNLFIIFIKIQAKNSYSLLWICLVKSVLCVNKSVPRVSADVVDALRHVVVSLRTDSVSESVDEVEPCRVGHVFDSSQVKFVIVELDVDVEVSFFAVDWVSKEQNADKCCNYKRSHNLILIIFVIINLLFISNNKQKLFIFFIITVFLFIFKIDRLHNI